MQINELKFENRIQLDIEGRIDVTGAPQVQDRILTSFQKTNTLIINLEKTEYVSSAGLRAFLIGQKTAASKSGTMKLVNVSDAVKDVLKVTGFSKIISVE